jgi:queuosine precursor transporter
MRALLSFSIIYVVIGMLSNISSLRIVQILGISMDAGTLLYPLTFTLRDLIHKKSDKKTAIHIVYIGVVMNLLMFIVFFIVSKLPADMLVGEQKEFGQVLVGSWRIIIASIVAMFIAEIADSQIYQWYADKFKKYQFMRVLTSNFISVPLDSAIVTLIAFYGVMPNSVLVSITIVNIAIKYIITLITVPSIYLVKEKLKN